MPLLAFIVVTIAIMTAGQVAFNSYRETLRRNAQNELVGIAELKAGQIAAWMSERRGDALTLWEDASFVAEVGQWLGQGSPSGEARARLRGRLVALQNGYADHGYTAVSLYDDRGVLRLSSSPNERRLRRAELERMFESMRHGQPEFSELHRDSDRQSSRPEIELWTPLVLVAHGKTHTFGAVLFRIDPSRFLFPLIRKWPTRSNTAESILIRREDDEIVFLNELRHVKNSPLVMHLPLSEAQMLATRAVLGERGLAEGVDYRGIPVVGVLSQVAGTSWHLISKMDQEEIYAPIDQLSAWIEGLTLAFVAGCGGIVLFWHRQQKKQYQYELERQALATHLDYLGKYANDVIMLLDGMGRIVEFNDRAVQTYGYSAEELSAMHLDQLLAIDHTLSHASRAVAIAEAGGALRFESVHVRRNGEKFPVEASVRRIDIGGAEFYQSIIRDITERKEAEGMLRFHSEILNNLSEGVVLVRIDDASIIFANPEFVRMFRYAPGELIGRHVSVLNAPEEKTPEAMANEINEELDRKGTWVGDLRNVRKDGSIFWCQATISAFRHPRFGKIAVSVHEDITERKDWERGTHERRKGMEELQKLHVAAQTASAIAHELNQPLLAIASYSKAALMMLKSDCPDFREIASAVEGSERQAHRAGQSIRELFDFLNSSEFPVEEFDLVQEIVVMLNDARTEHGLQFHSALRVEEKLPKVRANRTHVQKALFNLLHNGIEAVVQGASGASPYITVAVCRAADRRFAQVTVQDNGPGVSEEDAQHLFEPFFTTKGYGFGMGLTISRSLVEMNGGQLWIARDEGPGAMFHLTIPVAQGNTP